MHGIKNRTSQMEGHTGDGLGGFQTHSFCVLRTWNPPSTSICPLSLGSSVFYWGSLCTWLIGLLTMWLNLTSSSLLRRGQEVGLTACGSRSWPSNHMVGLSSMASALLRLARGPLWVTSLAWSKGSTRNNKDAPITHPFQEWGTKASHILYYSS